MGPTGRIGLRLGAAGPCEASSSGHRGRGSAVERALRGEVFTRSC
jgi:hypothetical protein